MGRPASPAHWVFLRGLVRETAHWDDFPERFAQALPGAVVHGVDLPGCGRHWREASPLALAEMVEAVRCEALALAGVDLPLYVLSISLGGMVALDWAQRHPQELAGAVLINTSLRGFSPLHQRLAWRNWPLLAKIIATAEVARRERLIFQLTSAQAEPRPGLIESRVAIHQAHPVRLANVFRQLCAAARHRPACARPAVPLLLLNSQGDRMVDPGCAQAIARAWALPVATHPWAGHDLPLDDARWVIDTVRAWGGCLSG